MTLNFDWNLKLQIAKRRMLMLRSPLWAKMPESVQLDTHNFCNLDCEYCNPQHSFNLPHGRMPTEMVRFILERFKRYPLFCFALFQNGEPTLDERLWDFCQMTKDITGVQNIVDTNGTVVAGRKNLLHPNLKTVRFTISAATPETYAVVHGKPYFDIAEETLKFFLENKHPHQMPWLHFIACKDNEHEVEAWIKRHKGIGQTIYPLHQSKSFQFNSEEVKGNVIKEPFFVFPNGERKPIWSKWLRQYAPCPCYGILGVSWQGEILECVDFPYRFNYGKVGEVDLMDAWRERLRNKMDNECCNTCNLRFPNWKETVNKWVK